MSLRSWLRNLRASRPRTLRHAGRGGPKRAAPHRPSLETLEDRCLLSFTPVASYAGNPALVADFNNDSVPDIARYSDGVLLGNGDGTFTAAPGPAVYGTAVGDFDGDGNLDLAAFSGSGGNVLLGNGAGTFQDAIHLDVTDPDTEEWVASVAVGDFNGDGNLDLGVTSKLLHTFYDYWYGYYGSYYTSKAHILLGNGSGGFSAPHTTDLGYLDLGSVSAADFNGDGSDDLVAVDFGYGVVVLPGDPSGYIQGTSQFWAPDAPNSVMVADVDDDGDVDLVTANFWGSVSVVLGNGSGGMVDRLTYATGSYQTSVAVADLNGDGKLDIVSTTNISSYPSYTGQLNILLGYGDGTFAPAVPQVLGPGWSSDLAAGDFDGDGRVDLVVRQGDHFDVLLNTGNANVPETLAIGDAFVTEGNSGTVDAVFTVTRKGNLQGTVTVSYETGGGDATPGSDYVAQTGTLTFGPGETSRTITIQVKGDLIDEYDQIFGVHLFGETGATLMDAHGFGTIVDDDPPPAITITPLVSAKEGNTGSKALKFVVTLSAPSEKEIRVNYATADGTATTADNDYVAASGTLVFAPGQTSKTISVSVRGDKKKEANETFFVDLTDPTNATIAGSQGFGEILNDDSTSSKGSRR